MKWKCWYGGRKCTISWLPFDYYIGKMHSYWRDFIDVALVSSPSTVIQCVVFGMGILDVQFCCSIVVILLNLTCIYTNSSDISFWAAAHMSDTTVMPQSLWHQYCCGLPQYFTHANNGTQVTAGWHYKWILTHNLTLTILTLSHRHSDCLSCKVHGGLYPTWCIHGDVYSGGFLACN